MEIRVWPIFAAVAEQRSVRQFALTFRELPPLFCMTTKGRQNLPMCRSIYPNGALPRIVPVEVTSMMPMILLPLAVCATTRMKYQTWAGGKLAGILAAYAPAYRLPCCEVRSDLGPNAARIRSKTVYYDAEQSRTGQQDRFFATA